jgi:3-oxoacyl-[acyl-carrier-protein] synthase III
MTSFVHITGWGAYTPPRVVTNEDLSHIVATSDSWIRDRTGIVERRIADDRDFTSTMAIKAGTRALEQAGLDPHKLDLVIVATCTPDYLMPATACLVQDGLGATRAAAFDLNAACSGFVCALSVAANMIRSGMYQNALVVGSESISRIVNWTDRGTCILFGDGAGAVVLQGSEAEGGVLTFSLGADGSGGDLLKVALGTRVPPTLENLASGATYLTMNGPEVFRFAARVVNSSTRAVMTAAGLTVEDIDLMIPHQANMRILQAAAKQLDLPMERIFSNVDRVGNTSAASVPLALVDAIAAGRLKTGDYVVLVGFGGGLTWGACLLQWTFDPLADTRGPIQRAVNSAQIRLAPIRGIARRLDRRLRAVEGHLRGRDTGALNGSGRARGDRDH